MIEKHIISSHDLGMATISQSRILFPHLFLYFFLFVPCLVKPDWSRDALRHFHQIKKFLYRPMAYLDETCVDSITSLSKQLEFMWVSFHSLRIRRGSYFSLANYVKNKFRNLLMRIDSCNIYTGFWKLWNYIIRLF